MGILLFNIQVLCSIGQNTFYSIFLSKELLIFKVPLIPLDEEGMFVTSVLKCIPFKLLLTKTDRHLSFGKHLTSYSGIQLVGVFSTLIKVIVSSGSRISRPEETATPKRDVKTYYFGHFSRKLHEIEKEIDQGASP